MTAKIAIFWKWGNFFDRITGFEGYTAIVRSALLRLFRIPIALFVTILSEEALFREAAGQIL